jgi:branched-chain amino acid transport system permease protein
MSATQKRDLGRAFTLGISGGLTLLLTALVGMVEQFSKRPILEALPGVDGPILLHEVMILGGLLVIGYLATRRSELAGPRGLPAAALAGLIGGLVLALFIWLGESVNLQHVLINAKASLYAHLRFGQESPIILPISGVLAGLAGGLLALVPARIRPGLVWGILTVALLGTLQGVLTRQVDLVTISRRKGGMVATVIDWIYANQGVAMVGALAIIALGVAICVLAIPIRKLWDDSLAALPSARRASTLRGLRGLRLAFILTFLMWMPLGLGTYPSDVLDTVGIYILMGLGLNIVVGFAGLLDLGYVAFYAIGAYTVAVLTAPSGGIEMPFWSALPLAVLASIVAGIILGIPVLKTHGDYLAIITLGFGEIIRILAISDALKPWLGGARGIQLIPSALTLPRLTFPLVGTMDPQIQQEMYYPILLAVGLALYLSWRLLHSRFGRAWMALREDEQVAEAMGINLVLTKLFAFSTGAAMAGLGGALFASKVQTIFPASFNLLISINILVLIIVGGMGSIPGVFVGALALVALPELLREFSDFRLLLYGVVLVIMMLKRPEGLWPTAIARRELAQGEGGRAA